MMKISNTYNSVVRRLSWEPRDVLPIFSFNNYLVCVPLPGPPPVRVFIY